MAAVVIRLVGYGVMIRLRGVNNSMVELSIVQLIHGIGSGVIQNAVRVRVKLYSVLVIAKSADFAS